MTKCRSLRTLMVEALNGKVASHVLKSLEDHMTSCPECAAEFEALSRTIQIMSRHSVPDPGPAYWDGYWERLEKRLDREGPGAAAPSGAGHPSRRLFDLAPKWTWTAASAVVLLAAGAVVGRYFLGRPASPVPAASVENAAPVSYGSYDDLINGASRYLDRSKVLLIALVNRQAGDDPAALDLARQKRVSNQLAKEAAVLKRGLEQSAGPEDRRLARLISDLEVILLQIANLEAESDPAAVDIIKLGVQSQGLIFQINLGQLRLDKASGPGRGNPGQGSGSVFPKDKSSA